MGTFSRPFDLAGLYAAVDDERRARGRSWASVSHSIGVAASTLRRYQHAADAEADGVLHALHWLGHVPERYVRDADGHGRPSRVGPAAPRVDMAAIAAASGTPQRNRSRTTIQRLVMVALEANLSVASLTRWPEGDEPGVV